jgi:shikimate 5-dehydrogenase
MINHKRTSSRSLEYPFFDAKIPVTDGLDGFRSFIKKYPGFAFCPYIADKDPEDWDKSTSRVYMNKILPRFLYVPVHIPRGNLDRLRAFFHFVHSRQDMPAVNITQPHKSNPVLRELYSGDENNADIDTLIRNNEGELVSYDQNSAAFIDWYKEETGPFQDKPVVLVGVGGVGAPIAKRVAAEKPRDLLLVDVVDKTDFATQLAEESQVATTFKPTLQDILEAGLPDSTIVINAAGKASATPESDLWKLIEKGVNDGTFVDIRAQMDIDIVEKAKERGWKAHTGHGTNARNAYVLLRGIARHIRGARLPSFEKFQGIVARAS